MRKLRDQNDLVVITRQGLRVVADRLPGKACRLKISSPGGYKQACLGDLYCGKDAAERCEADALKLARWLEDMKLKELP